MRARGLLVLLVVAPAALAGCALPEPEPPPPPTDAPPPTDGPPCARWTLAPSADAIEPGEPLTVLARVENCGATTWRLPLGCRRDVVEASIVRDDRSYALFGQTANNASFHRGPGCVPSSSTTRDVPPGSAVGGTFAWNGTMGEPHCRRLSGTSMECTTRTVPAPAGVYGMRFDVSFGGWGVDPSAELNVTVLPWRHVADAGPLRLTFRADRAYGAPGDVLRVDLDVSSGPGGPVDVAAGPWLRVAAADPAASGGSYRLDALVGPEEPAVRVTTRDGDFLVRVPVVQVGPAHPAFAPRAMPIADAPVGLHVEPGTRNDAVVTYRAPDGCSVAPLGDAAFSRHDDAGTTIVLHVTAPSCGKGNGTGVLLDAHGIRAGALVVRLLHPEPGPEGPVGWREERATAEVQGR